jgi:hypothetical protein
VTLETLPSQFPSRFGIKINSFETDEIVDEMPLVHMKEKAAVCCILFEGRCDVALPVAHLGFTTMGNLD